jgi:transposase-like protein
VLESVLKKVYCIGGQTVNELTALNISHIVVVNKTEINIQQLLYVLEQITTNYHLMGSIKKICSSRILIGVTRSYNPIGMFGINNSPLDSMEKHIFDINNSIVYINKSGCSRWCSC